MNLYFDNAAAMESDPFFTDRLVRLLPDLFSNQESPVSNSASAVKEAEQKILSVLCGKLRDQYGVFFTNTGTDAVNAVFQAVVQKMPGELSVSGGEHACIHAAAKRTGKKIRIIGNKSGQITQEDYRDGISGTTCLTAVHSVQPETGMIQTMPTIAERKNSLLLTDAIQGACKLPFDFATVQPDFFTVSGQKLGIPGGAAVLYKLRFRNLFRNLRFAEHCAGRVPPIFCILLAEACERWHSLMGERLKKTGELRNLLFSCLEEKIPGKFSRTIPDEQASPYIAHILLKEFQGAVITRALASKQIFTAPGSACDSETKEPSPALRWMKIPKQQAYNALRISFSPANDADGVIRLADELAQILHHY